MHIPDGYLSPSTCAAFGAVMIPAWAIAARNLKNWIKSKYIPLMAIGAAFSFTIMMYNVPIPDGTTAHAVGGGLLAVVLGPWAAMICVTIALAIQALLFGDGGVLTFTANCFNMALVLPGITYIVYRLISGGSELTSARRWVGAALGAYIGINAAACCAGLEFGLQPILFHTAENVPLYCPYPLGIAVPSMLFAHLVLAGPLEAVVTAMVVRYLQAYSTNLLDVRALSAAPLASAPVSFRKLWWAVGAMILLSPLGLLAKSTAWGEWGSDELQKLLGFVPSGMEQLSDTWTHAPLDDYSLPGFDSFWSSAIIYISCAVLAAAIISLLTYLFRKFQNTESKVLN
jgi:cobalt/nickel transport system permease protein